MKPRHRFTPRRALASLVAVTAWFAATPVSRATPAIPAQLPVADFARAPLFTNMQLSPDGGCVAYQLRQDGGSGFGFLPLSGEAKPVGFLWERKGEAVFNAIYGFQWISAQRVLLDTALGWAVVDRGQQRFRYITGYGRALEQSKTQVGTLNFGTFYPDGLVPDGRLDAKQLHMLNHSDISGPEYRPDVYTVNADTGAFRLLEKNPGNISAWGADWNGEIRFGLITNGVRTELIYRANRDDTWSRPVDFGTVGAGCSIAGLSADQRTLFVFKPSAQGRLALYGFDLVDRTFSGPVFQHDKYDVSTAIFSPKHSQLLGVRYITEGPRYYWFDPTLARVQAELDKGNGGIVNEIVSMDRDMRKLLIFSHSAREPGYYTIFDLETGKAEPLARTEPWINPAQMAEMFPVTCKARDGVELDGYLTLPPGRGQKNLPMVTLVHGGPYGIRDVWGYDPLVQFLANRGYAVLQVNFRGSGGYGTAFFDLGRHQVGAAMQDDVIDMTLWAVRHGIADPHRLAIMGGSYGGYSALLALARTPDMFRCGIAFAAVSDWNALFHWLKTENQYYRDAFRYWSVLLGDLQDDGERGKLAAASPVNLAAQMKAPVLLVHGQADGTVPIEQSRAMAAALKKAGHPAETLYFDYVGHAWPFGPNGETFLHHLEAFLAANMNGAPASVAPAGAANP